MQWNVYDGPKVWQLTVTTIAETVTGSPEPLSNDDFNAIVALLQSRGVLSPTADLESVWSQGSEVPYTLPT